MLWAPAYPHLGHRRVRTWHALDRSIHVTLNTAGMGHPIRAARDRRRRLGRPLDAVAAGFLRSARCSAPCRPRGGLDLRGSVHGGGILAVEHLESAHVEPVDPLDPYVDHARALAPSHAQQVPSVGGAPVLLDVADRADAALERGGGTVQREAARPRRVDHRELVVVSGERVMREPPVAVLEEVERGVRGREVDLGREEERELDREARLGLPLHVRRVRLRERRRRQRGERGVRPRRPARAEGAPAHRARERGAHHPMEAAAAECVPAHEAARRVHELMADWTREDRLEQVRIDSLGVDGRHVSLKSPVHVALAGAPPRGGRAASPGTRARGDHGHG